MHSPILKVESSSNTHSGLVREINEDRHIVKWLDDNTLLLAVADGMGGEPAGDYAAEIMLTALNDIKGNSLRPEQALADAVEKAGQAISSIVEQKPPLLGMGTTVTAVILSIDKNVGKWVHVGDSRLYLIRGGRLIQVTTDQTMAQFLVEEGEITQDQARTHPYSNLLNQCVGCPECDPDTGSLDIRTGDLIMLSTDGLHDALPAGQLEEILSNPEATIKEKAEAFVQRALNNGGGDNITVVLTCIGGPNPTS